MRVSIKHETVRRGAVFKKTFYEVWVTVLLTHEEIQIVRQRNLLETKLMDPSPAPKWFRLFRLLGFGYAKVGFGYER